MHRNPNSPDRATTRARAERGDEALTSIERGGVGGGRVGGGGGGGGGRGMHGCGGGGDCHRRGSGCPSSVVHRRRAAASASITRSRRREQLLPPSLGSGEGGEQRVIGVEKRRRGRRALPLVFISLSLPFRDAVCYVHSRVTLRGSSLVVVVR